MGMEVVLHKSAAETAGTVDGPDVDLSNRGERRSDGSGLRLYLDVTALVGTLDVDIERKLPSGNYAVVLSMAQATGTGVITETIDIIGGTIRAVSTIGTGPITFELLADYV